MAPRPLKTKRTKPFIRTNSHLGETSWNRNQIEQDRNSGEEEREVPDKGGRRKRGNRF